MKSKVSEAQKLKTTQKNAPIYSSFHNSIKHRRVLLVCLQQPHTRTTTHLTLPVLHVLVKLLRSRVHLSDLLRLLPLLAAATGGLQRFNFGELLFLGGKCWKRRCDVVFRKRRNNRQLLLFYLQVERKKSQFLLCFCHSTNSQCCRWINFKSLVSTLVVFMLVC